MEKAKELVIEIIADKLGFDTPEIECNLEQSITNDLGADSLDTVEIIMEIEKRFDIKIEDEDIQNVVTVADLIKKVEQITMDK